MTFRVAVVCDDARCGPKCFIGFADEAFEELVDRVRDNHGWISVLSREGWRNYCTRHAHDPMPAGICVACSRKHAGGGFNGPGQWLTSVDAESGDRRFLCNECAVRQHDSNLRGDQAEDAR